MFNVDWRFDAEPVTNGRNMRRVFHANPKFLESSRSSPRGLYMHQVVIPAKAGIDAKLGDKGVSAFSLVRE